MGGPLKMSTETFFVVIFSQKVKWKFENEMILDVFNC
jgi:hypothetical protein